MKLRVIDIFKSMNQKVIDGHNYSWIINVGDYFKPNSTKVWTNDGNINEASALMPQLGSYEELTNHVSGQNITSMLLISGIFKPIDSDGATGNIRNI